MQLLIVLSIPAVIAIAVMAIAITRDTWIGGQKWKP